MMGIKNNNERNQITLISLEDLVPKEHLVRKIDNAMDFSFIYEIVKDLYKPNGRESIDPVVLIKIIFIQYIFGISSMRKTIAEIEVNFAYRWFLGYGINEKIPHFSTFGKNYVRRFKNTDVFEKIFKEILKEAYSCGFIKDEEIFIDATHIKASANNHKYKDVQIEKAIRVYEDKLQKEIDEDREKSGKKPLTKNKSKIETINQKQSTTDKDSGVFHKGEHKKVFAYTSNTCCDENGFVLDFEVTSGNIHDSVSFWELYKRLKENKNHKYYVMDSGYKVPYIAKELIENNKIPVMPYKSPMGKKGLFKKKEFVYDEYYDCYLCPKNEVLSYKTTDRNGYRIYKTDKGICSKCEYIKECTHSKEERKTIARHIWEKYIEQVEDIRHRIGIKEIYKKRKQTIERVFADAKEKHGMRYTNYRGLSKIKMEISLLFSCMNLKKIANWKSKNRLNTSKNNLYMQKILQIIIKIEKWVQLHLFEPILSTV